MSLLSRAVRGLRRRFADDAGALAVEFALALPLVVSVATAAGDFGQSLRAGSALEAAVRDTARILSLTPMDAESGALEADGVALAFEVFARRMEEAGVEISYLAPDLDGAVCAQGGAPCYRIEAVEGSEELFGRTRYAVTVAATAKMETPLLALLRSDVAVGDDGAAAMTAEVSQLLDR